MEQKYYPPAADQQSKIPVTDEIKMVGVGTALKDLYKTLLDVEDIVAYMDSFLFGGPHEAVCGGEPDCLEANVCMARATADTIRERLLRIKERLN